MGWSAAKLQGSLGLAGMFIYLGRMYLIPVDSSCRAISCSDKKKKEEVQRRSWLEGDLLFVPGCWGRRGLLNEERVGAAVAPESFRLRIELSQQVFNDGSLGGIKTSVSQILKPAVSCLPPHSSSLCLSSFQLLALLSREKRQLFHV